MTPVSLPSQGSMFLGAYRMGASLKDCVVLVHGPSGCHFGPNFFEVLTNNLSSNATISVMRERSVVYGGIENLEKAIRLTRKHYKDKRIIVLSSHVPSIIGDDLEFIDADIYLDCGGFQPMWQGMEAFLEKLGDFICENENREDESTPTHLINIIGFQRDVAGAEEDLAELKRILLSSEAKVKVNVIPDSLESLRYARYASLSVVFGYGVKLARRMKREFGIPYIVTDYPYGVEGLKEFMEKLNENFEFEYDLNNGVFSEIDAKLKRYRNNLPLFYEIPVCVVGDLPRISGMSKFLERELGMNVELAFATSSALEKFDVSCTKFVSSYNAFMEEIKGLDIKVLLGTDEERKIINNTIVFAFPSFTRMSYVPYLGKGTLNLIADIYERIMEWI